MNNHQDNSILIAALVVLLFLFFGGFGMMNVGMYGMHNIYGNSYLCSTVGGIWCYLSIFGLLFMVLFWVVIVLLIVWVVRKLQSRGRR